MISHLRLKSSHFMSRYVARMQRRRNPGNALHPFPDSAFAASGLPVWFRLCRRWNRPGHGRVEQRQGRMASRLRGNDGISLAYDFA